MEIPTQITLHKDRRMKFMWSSNSPWTNSGYAVQTRDLMRRFIKDGWNTALLGFSGLDGSPISFEGYPVYGKMQDPFGSDAMYFHGKHFGANVIIPMLDAWVIQPNFLQQINNEGGKVVFYIPIDQDPIPPNVLSNLRFAYKIITFSKWGQKTLQRHGFTSTLILEGVDTNIIKPMDRMEFRHMFGISDKTFMIGMVGANKENPPRKGWQEALIAFKLFHDKHPDSIFWFECNQEAPGGFPIRQFAQSLGIQNQLKSLDTYMSVFHADSAVMAKLYSMFDILTHASLTEGFGLCIAEAQACGTPVVVNNYASMPELVIPGKTGLICDRDENYFFNNALSKYYRPDINSLYNCYEQLYASNLIQMGMAARKHILENYDIDKIYETKWKVMLEGLQDELLGPLTGLRPLTGSRPPIIDIPAPQIVT